MRPRTWNRPTERRHGAAEASARGRRRGDEFEVQLNGAGLVLGAPISDPHPIAGELAAGGDAVVLAPRGILEQRGNGRLEVKITVAVRTRTDETEESGRRRK